MSFLTPPTAATQARYAMADALRASSSLPATLAKLDAAIAAGALTVPSGVQEALLLVVLKADQSRLGTPTTDALLTHLVRTGVDVNEIKMESSGAMQTALLYAASAGRVNSIATLLALGADPNLSPGRTTYPPFERAIHSLLNSAAHRPTLDADVRKTVVDFLAAGAQVKGERPAPVLQQLLVQHPANTALPFLTAATVEEVFGRFIHAGGLPDRLPWPDASAAQVWLLLRAMTSEQAQIVVPRMDWTQPDRQGITWSQHIQADPIVMAKVRQVELHAQVITAPSRLRRRS